MAIDGGLPGHHGFPLRTGAERASARPVGSASALERMRASGRVYPDFDHFPTDPRRAEYYYFNAKGEVIPTPEKLTAIADNMLRSFFEPKIDRMPKRQGSPVMSVVYGGEQAGLRLIIEEAKRLAVEKYGVTAPIAEIRKGPEEERARLKKLEQLRTSGKQAERAAYLKEIEAEETQATDRVGKVGAANGGILIITETNPEVYEGFAPVDVHDLQEARQPARRLRVNNDRTWMLSSYPHKSTVAIDRTMNPGRDLQLEDEVYEWLQACERPLAEVLSAQEKLRGIMNRARQVRVIANADRPEWKTDVTFATTKKNHYGEDVPRGWFNHAGYEYNFPGSEVFGAPDKKKGNGVISYPYPVMFDGVLLPNLTVTVAKGKVVSWEIKGDANDPAVKRARNKFRKTMRDKKGNRYFGEIGIGTSPFPSFNTADIGFNEKRTGIHFALGKCYTDRVDEAGNWADLDNGNERKSNIHADLVLPSSNTNPVDMWVDIGTAQKPEWVLVLHNGAFVEKSGDGEYRADPEMQILSAPDAVTEFAEGFVAVLPQSKTNEHWIVSLPRTWLRRSRR